MLFEKYLQNLLLQNKSQAEFDMALENYVEDYFFEPGVLRSYYQYLLNTGCYKTLSLHFIKKINISESKLWPYFLEALSHCPVHISMEFKNALKESFLQTRQQLNASRSFLFHNHMSELSDSFKKLSKTKQQEYLFKKQELIDKLEFLKNEKLIEEEKNTLEQMQLEYPNEKQFLQQYQQEFQWRWSAHVLSQKKVIQRTEFKQDQLTEDQQSFLKTLEKEALQQVVKNPENGLHFCMMFYFMDQYAAALNILQKSSLSSKYSWLELELMLLAKHYLSALELAEKIEKKFYNTSDTDVPFAIAYTKALAYKGLKQDARAIEMLESILKFRPQYRQAERLMNEWLTNYDSLY